MNSKEVFGSRFFWEKEASFHQCQSLALKGEMA